MTRTPRILFALSLVLACEEGSGSTTDTGSTSSSPTDPTLGDTVSEPSTSTTGPADPTTSGTTGDASTSTTGTGTWCEDLAVLCQETGLDLSPNGTNYCAVVATMCAENVPPCQVCAYLESTCTQLGIVGACVDLNAECLCRAAAHDL